MRSVVTRCAGLLAVTWLTQVVSLANGADESFQSEENAHATLIVVVGSPGEDEFGVQFSKWAAEWIKAGEKANANCRMVGCASTNVESDLSVLKQAIAVQPTNGSAALWLVMIGHGTFDGREAKFNLRGPDLSATELAEWLKPFSRPLLIIDCASSSSPFINKISAPNRVVVTATRSGYEQNFARFGKFISEAIADPAADLDKDGQTSVLEAFILASRKTSEFYDAEGRLATEHALIDDNGDGLGTPADFFRGVRAVKKSAGGGSVDGLRAHQIHLILSDLERQMPPEIRARRDDLELAVARLREKKAELNDDDYYERLEGLLLQLAELYAQQPALF